MAQKVQIHLIDDLTNEAADETVEFAIDGVSFEIDLTAKNAEKLRNALAPYAQAGRRTGGRSRRFSKASVAGPSTAEIREWAVKNGYEVSARGRIADPIRTAYAEAHA